MVVVWFHSNPFILNGGFEHIGREEGRAYVCWPNVPLCCGELLVEALVVV